MYFLISKEWILFIAIALTVFLGAFYFLNPLNFHDFEFSFQKNGVNFFSNTAEPENLFTSLSNRKQVYIFASTTQNPSPDNSLIANNFVIPFSTVVSGNDKELSIFLKVMNSDNSKIIECLAKFPEENEPRTIPRSQCLNFAESEDYFVTKIFADFPDSASRGIVLIDDKSITIEAKDYSQLKIFSFETLKALFSNTDSIINNSNNLVNLVK